MFTAKMNVLMETVATVNYICRNTSVILFLQHPVITLEKRDLGLMDSK